MYDHGYVFTRIGKGVMHQTRSVRVDLAKFELSSENRRVLKKMEGIEANGLKLPLIPYDISIGKIGKDFYEAKFGPGIMSAQKIKEMVTSNKSNFNRLRTYSKDTHILGYVISYKNDNIVHYSYPFYDLEESPKDMGLGMMTSAINWAKENGLQYIYLGSLQRPGDTYKLQFSGLEWFDGKEWKTDLEVVKRILAKETA